MSEEKKQEVPYSRSIEKVLLGRIPIMIKSRFCVLDKILPRALLKFGECLADPGGYFIINGSEKVIVAQEQLWRTVRGNVSGKQWAARARKREG